jgi:hypothetical protein
LGEWEAERTSECLALCGLLRRIRFHNAPCFAPVPRFPFHFCSQSRVFPHQITTFAFRSFLSILQRIEPLKAHTLGKSGSCDKQTNKQRSNGNHIFKQSGPPPRKDISILPSWRRLADSRNHVGHHAPLGLPSATAVAITTYFKTSSFITFIFGARPFPRPDKKS